MKMHMILTVEDGPAALKQVAAVQGMAESLGIPLRMQPEDDPRGNNVTWGDKEPPDIADPIYKAARVVLGEPDADESMDRKEFVRAVAKRCRKPPRAVGLRVAGWLKTGIMKETV